jgi:hypothetical protein
MAMAFARTPASATHDLPARRIARLGEPLRLYRGGVIEQLRSTGDFGPKSGDSRTIGNCANQARTEPRCADAGEEPKRQGGLSTYGTHLGMIWW